MKTPPLKPRPALAQWLFDRDMTLREGAVFFDTSYETLRTAILPFGSPNLRPPYPALMRRIMAKTDGAIEPNQWFPQAGISFTADDIVGVSA